MSKFSKYILACGCSYTDENYESFIKGYDNSYDKWPTILGEKLDLPVKNLAKSGVDNNYIHDKVVHDISKNHDKIDLVVIGWAEYIRFNSWDRFFHHPCSSIMIDTEVYTAPAKGYYPDHQKAALNYSKFLFDKHMFNADPENSIIKYASRKHFEQIITIQNLCKAFGIKLIMASLYGSYNKNWNEIRHFFVEKDIREIDGEYIARAMLLNKNFSDVDRSSIIGWPFAESLHGYEYSRHIRKREHWISKDDRHPNKLGHKVIAEMYYERYKELYL